jgi:hypothetical protein
MSSASMTTGDMPQFAASNYTNSAYGLSDLMIGSAAMQGFVPNTETSAQSKDYFIDAVREHTAARRVSALATPTTTQEPKPMAKVSRRLVKVIVMDPNENIPLDKCILHSGEEKLTDLDDQELFFELDIKALLAAHNEERVKIADKKVKERVEHLEPARIRDLKMVVVTVAQF